MKVPRWITAGVVLGVVWLFVSDTPGTLDGIAAGLLTGLVLSLPVTYLFRALFPGRSELGRTRAMLPAAGKYLAVFVYELLTANVDVAKRVLAPSPRLDPGVLVVPLRVESDAAITTIANSITLTPGTLTMDYDADANALLVHAVDVGDVAAVVAPIRRWERYALTIFDEEADPETPARDVVREGDDAEVSER
ncbi:Na+/H+ antiporter subunit E [Halarchaeum acidiphilum]|uniref:Na+/H+ antiporter subunit E n=1 Tax=Halarchaeum acidiphilum TaxID=489138 RepID=UPI00067816F0|nr:Na+/H+ antiporter subunit E [Halarchaeum acidiphilum]